MRSCFTTLSGLLQNPRFNLKQAIFNVEVRNFTAAVKMHQRLSFKRRKILFSYPECSCCSKCILGQIEMNKPSSEIVFTEKCTCWRTFHKVPSGPARHLGPIQKMFICRRVRKETVKYFLLLNYISSELMLSLYSAYFLFTIHHSDSIQKLLTQSKNLS